MSKKFILILYGPQCSGKTTLANLIMDKYPEVFYASYNKIKWQISDYSPEKYREKGTIGRLNLSLAKQAAAEGFSILVEGNADLPKEIEEYNKIAHDHQLKILQVNIEAPYDVLLDRFNLRVKNAKEKDSKISVTEGRGMEERYNRYQELKNQKIPTFDSATLSSEDILYKIEQLFQ